MSTHSMSPMRRGERQLLYYETGWNAWPGTFWNSDWEREGLELAAAD